MILIYMAYDIFYINEISLSLPATTYTLINPMTRSQSRLSLNMRAAISRPPWYSPPAARARAERRSEFKAGTDCWLFPGAKTARGFSVPLDLEWHRKDLNLHCAT